MNEEPSYGAAKLVFAIMSVASWILILVGLVLVIFVGNDARGPIGFQLMVSFKALGLALFLGGFISLASAQVGRAVIDNAQISWAMLDFMRKHGQSPLNMAGSSTAPLVTLLDSSVLPGTAVTVRGRSGKDVEATLFSDGSVDLLTPLGVRRFPSQEAAQAYMS